MRESITSRVSLAFRLSRIAPALLAALVACDTRLDIDAPPPAMTADVDTMPTLPTSTLDIPLTYDLSPVVRELEKAVPKRFGGLDKRIELPNKRIHVAYEATRSPFTVSLDGQTARIGAVVAYKARGWYDPPIGPEISSSCGLEGPEPRARIALASDLRITPEWQLRGRSRVARVVPYSDDDRDKCRVTLFKINVTDRVIAATRDALEKQRTRIDRKIADIDIRSRFETWWHLLEQPIPLTDSVWLLVRPSAVRMDKAAGAKRTLSTALGFSASPIVTTGARPVATETPLPPLRTGEVGSGLHILLEGRLGYGLATDLIRKQLRGRKFTGGGRTIRVQDARLFGIGGGRLALELRFSGGVNGRVYLVGTPRYDVASNELYVPDLDYDAGSSNLLVQSLEWIKHDDVRNLIRAQARWPVGDIIRAGREQLSNGLNRDLAPGVRLSAEVERVQGLSVHARRSAIRVRAQADANARLTVRQGQ